MGCMVEDALLVFEEVRGVEDGRAGMLLFTKGMDPKEGLGAENGTGGDPEDVCQMV